ncbi:MAG TPA: hypothetical protein VFJ09_02680 [Nocardioidaceae bacterium]|nr:hypothetical protein [Nocardioidaceae bacterium]
MTIHTPTPTSPPAPPAMVSLTEHTVATVHELLAMCEEFLRTAGPAVHAELRAYLDRQAPPADPGWLVDMLGFSAMHLARQVPPPSPTPRESWQEVPR